MLFLSCKRGESVVIGDDVEVTVIEITGQTVKLGFMNLTERDPGIYRREVYNRIQAEKRAGA